MTTFLIIVFMAVAILMILVVLVQRGRGGGLAGAFGSGGGSTSAFGTKTGDVFTTLTVILFVIFMLLAIWLNMHFRPEGKAVPAPAVVTTPAGGDASKLLEVETPATSAVTKTGVASSTTATSAPATLQAPLVQPTPAPAASAPATTPQPK